MLHEFKNLSDVSKREFVLKYYPLILRSQQKKERLSKEEFLMRYLQVKRGEHAGKLLISKPKILVGKPHSSTHVLKMR